MTVESTADDTGFAGHERFDVERRLGAGGMGVVYQAYDRQRGARVALKTMLHVGGDALYQFKQEFRSLADVAHPNLIALYELFVTGERWFFTMELLDGVSFLQHVRPGDARARRAASGTGALSGAQASREAPTEPLAPPRGSARDGGGDGDGAEAGAGSGEAPSSGHLDVARLRDALRQLAEGLNALHQSNKLHCDIKPANVMVTRDGRVVLLDFGLVTDYARRARGDGDENEARGTVRYMSPEQAAAAQLTPASDWYSVGVMLFEALTGRAPFEGAVDAILARKQREPAPRVEDVAPGAPADLAALCAELLATRPEQRPSGAEVARRLAAAGAPAPQGPPEPAIGPDAVALVGRERHLAVLREAFDITRGGRGATVFVHGRSGMGKSRFVQGFLESVAREHGAVVVQGRCYERESVPFKAVDPLVDELTEHLLTRPAKEVNADVPRDAAMLARLFPVLLRLVSVAAARRKAGATVPDPQELRRRAFDALKVLLARLAARAPLVLFVDDLQWADADSAALLLHVLSPPDAPAALVVLAFRGEDIGASGPVRALLDWRRDGGAGCETREVEVGPLSDQEARDLALALLPRGDAGARAQAAAAVAREAGGNPFFIYEASRYLAAMGGGADVFALDRNLSLADVLNARIARLPPSSRRLLEVVAVAGNPVPEVVAARAAALGGAEYLAAIAVLRAGHFARTRSAGSDEEVETFHDRIRETLTAGLAADQLRDRHGDLASALRATGHATPEALARHYHGAGDDERAARYAVEAAGRAADALAFDRAAEFYRHALAWRPDAGEKGRALRAKLGEALVHAGRGADAARVFLEAAAGAAPDEAREFERRAAEQFLRSGHVAEGTTVVRRVLAAVGLTFPETPRRALLSLVARRIQIRLRGLKFTPRAPESVPKHELDRVDVCWSIAVGLGMVDTVRGADFNTRTLLYALAAGDPYRVARSLALEVPFTASAGGGSRARVAMLLERTRALVATLDAPHAQGLAEFVQGASAFLLGGYAEARDAAGRAEEVFRARCTGVAWEVASAQLFGNMARFYLGAWDELAARVPEQAQQARDRGDRYAATNLVVGHSNAAWLWRDDPDGARAQVSEAMKPWSEGGFHMAHFFELMALTHADLYAGDGASAWERVAARWPALAATMLLEIQHLRLSAWILRASAALGAAAAKGGDARALLAAAEKDARRIEREKMAWATPVAKLYRAAIAARRGDAAGAAALLDVAARGFDAADMALYAHVARRRKGELDGAVEAVEAADRWMRERGAQRPERIAEVLGPGFAKG